MFKLIIPLLIFVLPVGLPDRVVAQKVTVEKVRAVPLDLGDEIAGIIADLVSDAEGRLFMTDYQQNAIWVTDRGGGLIRRIGREGSGPGDLMSPLSISLFEDKLIVLDSGNSRISIFATEGEHLAGFRIEPQATGAAANAGGFIAVKTAGNASSFTVYDMEGARIEDAGDVNDGFMGILIRFSGVPPSLHIRLTPDGHVLTSDSMRYDVRRMDWDGEVIATYVSESPGYTAFEMPKSNVSSIVVGKWTPMLRPLEVGHRVLVQWMARKVDAEGYGYHGDLYRSDGVPLELALDLPTRFLYADGDELYGVDTAPVDEGEFNPHIVIYRLADDRDP